MLGLVKRLGASECDSMKPFKIKLSREEDSPEKEQSWASRGYESSKERRGEEMAGPGLQHQEAFSICSFILPQSEHQLELFNGITRAAVPLLTEEGVKMTAANKHKFLISRLIRLISQTEGFRG